MDVGQQTTRYDITSPGPIGPGEPIINFTADSKIMLLNLIKQEQGRTYLFMFCSESHNVCSSRVHYCFQAFQPLF